MKFKKIISTFLAVLMLIGACTMLVNAEEEEAPRAYQYRTDSVTSLMKKNTDKTKNDEYLYKTGEYEYKNENNQTISGVVQTAEDKLSVMDYRYGNDNFELYVDAYSGEVAVKNKKTGDTLFTNPYDLSKSKASAINNGMKDELLSQLTVKYTDIATNATGIFNSYTEAALRNQIAVSYIKNGIRVEYAIGTMAKKSIVPRAIEASALMDICKVLEENIKKAVEEGKEVGNAENILWLFAFEGNSYIKYTNESADVSIKKQYPIVETHDIYLLDAELSNNHIAKLENLMKEYYPEYSFEDLEEDHAFVGYEAKLEAFPLFNMALEYTLDEEGLSVRLPANSIRFDETRYRLDHIEILPWMGAGKNPNAGYTFFPDGSGALFDFQEVATLGGNPTIQGKVYGQDYAYHEIDGKYEEIIRYPVFGLVETQVDADTGVSRDRGFVAIVEEGDSLLKLTTYHGGQVNEYNTVKMTVEPRPTDSYNLADAISVGSNTEWTVVSSRKYTGNYKIRYVMLVDDAVAAEKGLSGTYDCSYIGMANAYRAHLIKNGMLTKLTDADVSENIPLYIETFGAVETTEKFLSIPFTVMTPLTSFADVAAMYDELKVEGITNINFILTGYTKGGMMMEKVPYYLKWERAVSKDMDFEELLAYAKQEGFGLFPDTDFVFATNDTWFDGLSLKKHAAKTIDNRYTSKREYSATKHSYVGYFDLVLSAAYYSHFYEKFIPAYSEYEPIGISVSTLGSYLSSDFDEDEPYNRADSQNFTVQAFDYIDRTLPNAEIMTSGGNAYAWKYVDHITDIALDSSRFHISSAAVPFLGIVLHGYVEIAGTPLNMEGNLEYFFLKSLENGAALNFVLSYQNTEVLKQYVTLSQYYSVQYDIWFEDLVSMYLELNDLLKGVQTSEIVAHQFLNDGTRVPDADELELDAWQSLEASIAAEKNRVDAANAAAMKAIRQAKDTIEKDTWGVVNAKDATASGSLAYLLNESNAKYGEYDLAIADALSKHATMLAKKKDYDDVVQNNYNDTVAKNAAKEAWDNATAAYNESAVTANKLRIELYALITEAKDTVNRLSVAKDAVKAAEALLKANPDAYTSNMREYLFNMITPAFEAAYDEYVVAGGYFEQVATALDVLVENAYTLLNGSGSTPPEGLDGDRYVYVPEQEQGSGSVGTVPPGQLPVTNTTKYDTGANTIVYEAYANGTAFILNFNDYRVVVTFNGVSYTIDAYGYVVLSRGA